MPVHPIDPSNQVPSSKFNAKATLKLLTFGVLILSSFSLWVLQNAEARAHTDLRKFLFPLCGGDGDVKNASLVLPLTLSSNGTW